MIHEVGDVVKAKNGNSYIVFRVKPSTFTVGTVYFLIGPCPHFTGPDQWTLLYGNELEE
jgi:hypothetical protein